ncbi:hypothetical protein ACFWUZ_33935 [Streptomyces sp. NPDC058646]|uniref:hypothetical protein n=1 Tax=Streptomyces sp. NPDC058646 TaxID=3346574 RepID=UPI00364628D9
MRILRTAGIHIGHLGASVAIGAVCALAAHVVPAPARHTVREGDQAFSPPDDGRLAGLIEDATALPDRGRHPLG